MPVVVAPYDPTWPATYQHLKSAIWPKVQAVAEGIEHVGSTSVPGLAAKPVIDIDIVVSDPATSDLAIGALQEIGYQHAGNLGLEGREAMKEPEGSPRHNLYVCLQDSEPFRNHILIRDHLLSNPDSVREYGDLKLQLATKFPNDIDGYIDGKTDFLISILKQSGFGDEAARRAEAINRKKSPLPKLAAPAQRALAGIGITHLEQLATHSESEIKNLHDMGPNAMAKLKEAMLGSAIHFQN